MSLINAAAAREREMRVVYCFVFVLRVPIFKEWSNCGDYMGDLLFRHALRESGKDVRGVQTSARMDERALWCSIRYIIQN